MPRGSPSVFPSASAQAPAPIELGVLRNGLGSLRNLEGLLSSIKVSPKELAITLAEVRADCPALRASASAAEQGLLAAGVDSSRVRRLGRLVSSSVSQLESELSGIGRRLSVSQRLSLERRVGESVAALDAALPLVAVLDRAARVRPAVVAPAALVHEPVSDPEGFVSGMLCEVKLTLEPEAERVDLGVDLDVARTLVALGLGLIRGASGGPLQLGVFSSPEIGVVTSIARLPSGAEASGKLECLVGAPSGPATAECAVEAARLAGVRFQIRAKGGRVELFWPATPLPPSSASMQ